MHYFLEHFVWNFISIWLLIEARYVWTLRRALFACSRGNRALPPALLWVELLPVIGLAWQFVNVVVLAKSLEDECRARGVAYRRPGQRLGLTSFALQIVALACALPANGGSGPFSQPTALGSSTVLHGPNPVWLYLCVAGYALMVAFFITWIWYWRLMSYLSEELGPPRPVSWWSFWRTRHSTSH